MKIIHLVAVFFMFLLIGCSDKNLTDNRIHELIDEGFGEKDHVLIHKEKVANGLVVIYGDPKVSNTLGVRFIKKTLFDWKATIDRGGGGFGKYQKDIDGMFLSKSDTKSPFPLLLGLIKDRNISKIKVEYKINGKLKEVDAEIIKGDDRIIWFAFVDDEPNNNVIYTIKGYSKIGKLIETTEVESI